MAKCRRAGTAGIYRATLMSLACTHVMLAAIQAMAAKVSTPQTLARKRSKCYVHRIAAGGLDTTSSEDEEETILNETGVPPAFSFTAYTLMDAVMSCTSCPELEGQAVYPIAGLGGSAARQGVSCDQVTCHLAGLCISSSKLWPILSAWHARGATEHFFPSPGPPSVGTIRP